MESVEIPHIGEKSFSVTFYHFVLPLSIRALPEVKALKRTED